MPNTLSLTAELTIYTAAETRATWLAWLAAECADRLETLLRRRGMAPQLCQALVIGGGSMFPQQFAQGHVGEHNARWALAALQREGIAVVHQDLGGSAYRRLGWTVGPGAPEVVAVAV